MTTNLLPRSLSWVDQMIASAIVDGSISVRPITAPRNHYRFGIFSEGRCVMWTSARTLDSAMNKAIAYVEKIKKRMHNA